MDDSHLQAQLRHFALQKRNMDAMLAFDRLRSSRQLAEAEVASAALVAALQQQVQDTLALNRRAPPGLSPLDPPYPVLIDILMQRADLLESLARPQAEVQALREQALALARELGGKAYAERQRQLAGTHLEQGRFHEALATLVAARELFVAAGDMGSAARCTSDLANAFEWLGDFERALQEVQRGRALLGDPVGELIDAEAVAASLPGYAARGTEPAMLDAVRQLEQRVTRDAARCDLLQVEARCRIAQQRYEGVPALLEQARPMVQAYAHPALDVQLIKIQLESGRHAQALEAIQRLLPVFESGPLRRKLGVLRTMQARALNGLQRHAEALKAVRAAQDALQGYNDPEAEAKAFEALGDSQAALGQEAAALDAYEQAASGFDWLRRAPLGYRLDSLALLPRLPLYRRAIALAARLGDGPAAARFIESIKSRQLAATLAVPGGGGADSELTRRLDLLNQQLAGVGYSGGGELPLAQLVAERQALLERIRIEEPRWRTLTEAPPIDVAAWCSRLAAVGQAALTLHLDGSRLTAVLLQGTGCHVASRELAPELSATLSRLRQPAPTAAGEVAALDEAAAGIELADVLPDGLLTVALAAGNLLVAPHGPLHLLPWPLLKVDGAPAFQRLAIGVAPNLAGLSHAAPAAAPRGVLAVGVSSQHHADIDAEAECRAIARRYADAGLVADATLVGAKATRAALLARLHGPVQPGVLLHLACHGEFDLDDPMSSHLALADGRVDAASIVRGRLAYDEVLLSACSTGRRGLAQGGVELSGDEIIGLAGAFLEAGARSVLVSLCPTADQAALELMQQVHAERIAGHAPRQALQRAQQQMAADGIFPPGQWGGFVVFGCA